MSLCCNYRVVFSFMTRQRMLFVDVTTGFDSLSIACLLSAVLLVKHCHLMADAYVARLLHI